MHSTGPADRRRRRRRPGLPRAIAWLGYSLLFHIILLIALRPWWSALFDQQIKTRPMPVSLILEIPDPVQPPDPDDEEPVVDGQLVELPRPDVEEVPVDADYLAEHNRVVEEETRTERFRINPEVLAESYSEDDSLQFEDQLDLNITEPSTGAQVGNDKFDPDRDGTLASLPSPFSLTNKDGLQKPVPASTRSQDLAGAPQNDLLDEKVGSAVNLNTREFIGAGYINRIRRLVNFYWQQNLDNLPNSVRLTRPRYQTVVEVVLDSNGALESIEVGHESGIAPLDHAVVEAFRLAGPFPNPPEQLISKDGRVYLPNMGFTVEVGQARAAYMGVDPRQGVQFPGILKSPR